MPFSLRSERLLSGELRDIADRPLWVGHDLPTPREAVTKLAVPDVASRLVIRNEDEEPIPESSSRPTRPELKVSLVPPPTYVSCNRTAAASLNRAPLAGENVALGQLLHNAVWPTPSKRSSHSLAAFLPRCLQGFAS